MVRGFATWRLMTWMLCYIGWWLGCFDTLVDDLEALLRWFMAWSMRCLTWFDTSRLGRCWSSFGVDSWSLELEACSYLLSYFFMQAGACYPWGLDSSNHSWLGPRDTSWVLYKELVLSLLVGVEKNLRRLKSSASPQLIVLNGFYQWIYYWVFHLHLVYLVYMVDLLLLCIED